MNPKLTIFFFIGNSLIWVAIGLPLYFKKVPPNRLYGFRTPTTLSSKEIWYPANQRLGRNFAFLGLIDFVVMSLIYLIGSAQLPIAGIILAMAAVTVVSLIACLIDSFVYVRKIAERNPGNKSPQ
jgi:uncharacterized membrane protein